MTAHLGNLALWLAAAAAAWTLAACQLAASGTRRRWLKNARAGIALLFAALALASVSLVLGLLTNNLQLSYVAGHSSASTPAIYRIAAMWSGHEGSLLLWATLSAGLSAAFAVRRRGQTEPGEGVTLATLATTCGFFTFVLILGANPFILRSHPLAGDGHGLNPLLQHWAMAIHPPTLFVGYAASLIPFARLLGAAAGRQTGGQWMREIRAWALLTWIALSAGIVLGARWAYVELGWGGYWAWDPVENASLLPWLTCTGLVHTLKVDTGQRRWGIWAALLCTLTFLLCVLGTYLTRSGIVQSVHAFGQSALGIWFLAFLGVASLAASALVVGRRRSLSSSSADSPPTARESALTLANVLLLLMAAATLMGTLAPALSSRLARSPITVTSGYYQRLVVPFAVACLGLMILAPFLPHVRTAGPENRGRTRGGVLRRPSVLLAHGGALVMAIGIGGSSLMSKEISTTLEPGQNLVIGRHTLRFEDIRQIRGSDCTIVQASLTLIAPDGTPERVLNPERRFSDLDRQATAQVAIRSTLRDDLYITLAGWEPGGTRVAIQARVLPMTLWIWIGAAAALGGTGLCLLRRLVPVHRMCTALPRGGHTLTTPAASTIDVTTSHAGAHA